MQAYLDNLYGIHLQREQGHASLALDVWEREYEVQFALELAALFSRLGGERIAQWRSALRRVDAGDPFCSERVQLRQELRRWLRTMR